MEKMNIVSRKNIIFIFVMGLLACFLTGCGSNESLSNTTWELDSFVLNGVTYGSNDNEFIELINYSGEYSLYFADGDQIKMTMASNFNEAFYAPYTVNGNNITVTGVNGDLVLVRNGNKISLKAPISGGDSGTLIFKKK